MLGSYLINPILEQLTWFIKKSKQFNQSGIVALTLTLKCKRALNFDVDVNVNALCNGVFTLPDTDTDTDTDKEWVIKNCVKVIYIKQTDTSTDSIRL